jgi:hypothetical protein
MLAQGVSEQPAFQRKTYLVEVSLVGGLNYHSFIYENPEPIADFDGKLGYRVGINTLWRIQKVRISVGLMTERKGRVYTVPVTYFDDQLNPMSGTIRDRLSLNYFVVPANFNFNILKSDKLSGDVGFYVGYLQNAKSITDFSWQRRKVTDVTTGYKRVDFGINMGVTFKLIQISDLYEVGVGPYTSIGLTPNDTSPANRNFSFGLLLSLTKSKVKI